MGPADIVKYLWLKLYLTILGGWKTLQEQVYDRHIKPKSNTFKMESKKKSKKFCPIISDLPTGSQSEVIVITGGNRGIGWEAVKTLLPLGYHVIIGEWHYLRVYVTVLICTLL